jgi:hypothetical protein
LVAVVWTAVVSAGLLAFVLATGISAGAVILVLPLSAAALAFAAPRSVAALAAADMLLGVSAVLLLIGGEGLLYVPPLVLLFVATARAGSRRAVR